MSQPSLTFFCELPDEALSKLFDGRFVIDDLIALDATLALGILDLSEARAKVVKRLNTAGVPVVAWLLLPEVDGYWFNIDNHDKAAARYVNFIAWTAKYELQWAGIGLDIEMDINEIRSVLASQGDRAFAAKLWRKIKDKARVVKARQGYQVLIDTIHADGYPIESYHIPLITEERRAHATVLQRTVGLVDLVTDREVLMLYTSFLRPQGPAVLWSYAPDADSIGVGSTGGGVDLAESINAEPLTWKEFARDLRLCAMQSKPIHIFSLEGCVEQGFLSKLNTFDWEQVEPIPEGTYQVRFLRTAFAVLLWIIERPWVILIALASLVGLGFLFKQAGDKRQKHQT